jgi:EpsI family protein
MKKTYYSSIALLLIGGIIGNLLRFTDREPDKIADFSKIPDRLGNYSGIELKLNDATYEVLKADLSTYREYVADDQTRDDLFIAYFKSQKYGGQIHSPKHCLPGGGWRIESIEPFRLELTKGDQKLINRLVIGTHDYKSVMFYWYETRSGTIRNEYALKFDLVKNALLFRPTDAAIVRLTVTVPDGDIKTATAAGIDFLQKFHPYIIASLPF